MTVTYSDAARDARSRADRVAALRELADWLETHPSSAIPLITAQFLPPAGTHETREAWITDLALDLGTEVDYPGMGTMRAQRWFGPEGSRALRAAACFSDEDDGTVTWNTRAAALRAAQAGTEAAA